MEIPSTPADGNVAVWLVPAFTDPALPKVTEASAAGSVDASCYFTGDGYTPSLDEQVIADERLCSTQTYEKKGRSQRSLEVKYIDNTNTPQEEEFNKAKDTLVPGSAQYVLVRRGKPFDEPLAAGDKVTISPITPGEYRDEPPEANSVLKISQKLFITGKTEASVELVAGP